MDGKAIANNLKDHPMKVTLSPLAEIGMRTMTDDNRQMVSSWFDELANWETDASLRQLAKQLPSNPQVFILKMNNDLRLLFKVAAGQIEVLDFPSRDWIMAFAPLSATHTDSLPAGAAK